MPDPEREQTSALKRGRALLGSCLQTGLLGPESPPDGAQPLVEGPSDCPAFRVALVGDATLPLGSPGIGAPPCRPGAALSTAAAKREASNSLFIDSISALYPRI
jgi:hypothetical protein